MEVSQQSGFAWTARQYVGGALALDLCNTFVFYRWPERRTDRLVHPADLRRWWEAACRFCTESDLPFASTGDGAMTEVRFRETLLLRDLARSLFSQAADGTRDQTRPIGTLLALSAGLLHDSGIRGGSFGLDPDRPQSIPGLVCASTLGLLWRGPLDRVRACPNCDYLFLDRSRNRSRKWCDMEVCGNRAKAERLLRRRADAS